MMVPGEGNWVSGGQREEEDLFFIFFLWFFIFVYILLHVNLFSTEERKKNLVWPRLIKLSGSLLVGFISCYIMFGHPEY